MNPLEVAYDTLNAPDCTTAWNAFSSKLEQLGLLAGSLTHSAENNLRFPGLERVYLTTDGQKYYSTILSLIKDRPFNLYSTALRSNSTQIIQIEDAIQKDPHETNQILYKFLLDINFRHVFIMPMYHAPDNTFAATSFVHHSKIYLEDTIRKYRLENALVYLSEALLVRKLKDSKPNKPLLSNRELDCLAWYNLGQSAYEIGYRLNISEYTVNEYFRSARKKLKASNTILAASRALLLNLYSP